MHYQNLEKLKRLRLFGMARALDELQRLVERGQLDFDDQLALLIDREATTAPTRPCCLVCGTRACVRPPASRTTT